MLLKRLVYLAFANTGHAIATWECYEEQAEENTRDIVAEWIGRKAEAFEPIVLQKVKEDWEQKAT